VWLWRRWGNSGAAPEAARRGDRFDHAPDIVRGARLAIDLGRDNLEELFGKMGGAVGVTSRSISTPTVRLHCWGQVQKCPPHTAVCSDPVAPQPQSANSDDQRPAVITVAVRKPGFALALGSVTSTSMP
jgi:hypothetical protein